MSTTTLATGVQPHIVDASHSQVNFIVRHMGFSKVRGRFESFEATVHMEPGDLSTLEAEAVIQVASVTTQDEKRDAHLRSGDFFLVDEHPTLTFRSTGVRDIRGNAFTLAGDLTMRGVTRQVELEGEFLGEGTDPWGGTRVAFEAGTTINRKDFGLNWNAVLETGGFLVSEDVRIVLEIQAVRRDG